MDEYYCKAHPHMSSTDCDALRHNDPYLNIQLDFTLIRVSSDKMFLSFNHTDRFDLRHVSQDKVIQQATIVSWLSNVGVPEDAFALVVKEIAQCICDMGDGVYRYSRGLSIRVDFSITRRRGGEDEESNCLDENEDEMEVEEDEDNTLVPSATIEAFDENDYNWNSYWEEEMGIEDYSRLFTEIFEDDRMVAEVENDEDERNYGWEEVTGIEEDIRFVPTAKSCVEGLKTVTTEKAEKCSICFEDFNVGVGMPCSHMFHVNCIQDWLNVDNFCPLCRFKLPTDNTNE